MTSDGWWKEDITCNNDCMPCLLQEDGWKLSRTNYYQEGWLATANVRGVVGVTYTTSFCAGTQVSSHVWRCCILLRRRRRLSSRKRRRLLSAFNKKKTPSPITHLCHARLNKPDILRHQRSYSTISHHYHY